MTLVNNYKTRDEYIRFLANQKGVTLKQMCEDLGISYISFKSGYLHRKMRRKRQEKIMNYLDGDIKIIESLPVKFCYYK
mgnify:CR=1 FL=1